MFQTYAGAASGEAWHVALKNRPNRPTGGDNASRGMRNPKVVVVPSNHTWVNASAGAGEQQLKYVLVFYKTDNEFVRVKVLKTTGEPGAPLDYVTTHSLPDFIGTGDTLKSVSAVVCSKEDVVTEPERCGCDDAEVEGGAGCTHLALILND